ncbi:MAG: nitrogen fixation protein NifH [Solirubrobacterales bacterium]
MRASKPVTTDAVLAWLLEPSDPSIRYLTLVELLGRPKRDVQALEARRAIMETGPVPEILAKQHEDGYWETREAFYEGTIYKGTVWTLILLAELRADGGDARIRNACEFVLNWSQDRDSGGFACRGTRDAGGAHDRVVPCLTGNMVWVLARFGYLGDPRWKQAVQWITTYQRFDDGASPAPKGWPYSARRPCWGRHTCHMGVVKSLKALAEIPANRRTQAVRQTIDSGVGYLLAHHIHKRSHDLSQVSRPQWLKLGFPWMWDSDILEILEILTRLGCRDGRMAEALEAVQAKRQTQGHWLLEDDYYGRLQTNIEKKGRPSKWVTLNALRVMKRMHARD